MVDSSPGNTSGGFRETCTKHGESAATGHCSSCGNPICDLCKVTLASGRLRCLDCLHGRAQPGAQSSKAVPRETDHVALQTDVVLPNKPPDADCLNHPGVPAMAECNACGAAICDTCGFVFDESTWICPPCAVAPRDVLSGRRKGLAIAALCIASVNTMFLLALFLGVGLSSLSASGVLGLYYGFVFLAVAGSGIGVSTMEKRLGNTALNKIGAFWNLGLYAVMVGNTLISVIFAT